MDWEDPFDGLQLNDDFVTNDQIYFVSAIKLQTLIRDGKIDLALEGYAPKMKFVAQTLFVSRFQQSKSKLTMHLDRRTNDRSGSRVFLVFVLSVSL
jgi:hypothetical protein